jgi:precorrin-2/cobalt-factor-2 C20-methyltransferase
MSPGPVRIIGVGPGDPELLTILGVRRLAESATILHPGPRDDAGFAFEVVAGLLRPDQKVRGMALAMRRGPDDGTVGYEKVASALIEEARAGRTAAFLTEGDPMLFGTGSYVVEMLKSMAPELPLEVVPGVSALGAAAARLGWPLAQKGEILTVCPATYHESSIGEILGRGGASCWLKARGVLPRLVEELTARGMIEKAALIERVGWPDERIVRDLREALGREVSYFAIVLVRA